MDYKTIIFEKKENYVIITLNRPDKLNALNKQMFDDLDDAFKKIELDRDVQALILTGTGDKAFAAGADIKELNESDERSGSPWRLLRHFDSIQQPQGFVPFPKASWRIHQPLHRVRFPYQYHRYQPFQGLPGLARATGSYSTGRKSPG